MNLKLRLGSNELLDRLDKTSANDIDDPARRNAANADKALPSLDGALPPKATELVPYPEFATLRLLPLLAKLPALQQEVRALKDWEFMGGKWVGEALGFTEFLIHPSCPGELGAVALELGALPAQVAAAALQALQLPLRAGMSTQEIKACLGDPINTVSFVEDRITYEFEVGTNWPYYVHCTVHLAKGLTYVVVICQDSLALCGDDV